MVCEKSITAEVGIVSDSVKEPNEFILPKRLVVIRQVSGYSASFSSEVPQELVSHLVAI